jgi:hypothetical protein
MTSVSGPTDTYRSLFRETVRIQNFVLILPAVETWSRRIMHTWNQCFHGNRWMVAAHRRRHYRNLTNVNNRRSLDRYNMAPPIAPSKQVTDRNVSRDFILQAVTVLLLPTQPAGSIGQTDRSVGKISAGPRQHTRSCFQVQRYTWQYFAISLLWESPQRLDFI